MKSHEVVVRIRDDERLAELEKVIAKGQKTFVEVGLALAEIRDLRLYKREHSNLGEALHQLCDCRGGGRAKFA
jgi:hypothetical protein